LGPGSSRTETDPGRPLPSLSPIDARTRQKVRGFFPRISRLRTWMLAPGSLFPRRPKNWAPEPYPFLRRRFGLRRTSDAPVRACTSRVPLPPEDEYITGVLAPHDPMSLEIDSGTELSGEEDVSGDDQAGLRRMIDRSGRVIDDLHGQRGRRTLRRRRLRRYQGWHAREELRTPEISSRHRYLRFPRCGGRSGCPARDKGRSARGRCAGPSHAARRNRTPLVWRAAPLDE